MTAITRRLAFAASLVLALSSPAFSQTAPVGISAKPGWSVSITSHSFPVLLQRLEAAIQANKMGLVNAASASEGAKAQGISIPGNRVIGVFRNDFARRMLAASLASGIEAPVRFYVTENADGKATLSYRTPSAVFEPYMAEASPDLKSLAGELDVIFAKIAAEAASP